MLKYKINLSTLNSGNTASINIPISQEFQLVDQSELIEKVFVDVEVEKAINPILDYEKVRFLPTDLSGTHIDKVTYNLNIDGQTSYGGIGFTDDDIKFEKNNFLESFLNLFFFDTDNPLTQKLISNITLFSEPPTQLTTANQLPLSFMVSNPILNPRGFAEGYHLYDFKDELKIGEFKYLYMRASFKNAKNGKSLNLMVQSNPDTIDNLVHKLYTRYKLVRNNSSFNYEIDDSYHGDGTSGSNNVTYLGNNVTINLYQIKAL